MIIVLTTTQIFSGLKLKAKILPELVVGQVGVGEIGGMGELCTSLLRIKVESVFHTLRGWLFLSLHSISALPPYHIMSHYCL